MSDTRPGRQAKPAKVTREERARAWRDERLIECLVLRAELNRFGPWFVLRDLLRGNPKRLPRALAELDGRSDPELEPEELEYLAEAAAENLQLYAKGILPDGDLEAHVLPLRLALLKNLLEQRKTREVAYHAFKAGIDWQRSRETMLMAVERDRAKKDLGATRTQLEERIGRHRRAGELRRGHRDVPEEKILSTVQRLREEQAPGARGWKMEVYRAAAASLTRLGYKVSERTVRRVCRHELLEAHRINQAALARDSGVSLPTITRLVRNETARVSLRHVG